MAEAVTEKEVVSDDWSAAMNEQSAAPADADVDGTFGGASPHEPRPSANPALFQQFDGSSARPATRNDIDLVLDIPVQLTVELGRTKLPIRKLLQLAQGSVVELDGLAGEPMDVLVNGCLIAQGEVVVVNEKFGIRLTDVITPSERMKRLNK
ncbi:MAG: flagellar motor switch protein FliN [Betaproteobacteria bacterium]|nr:MAG: flagellar motor switch protein FliN [Betaproteobacteria bacterium]